MGDGGAGEECVWGEDREGRSVSRGEEGERPSARGSGDRGARSMGWRMGLARRSGATLLGKALKDREMKKTAAAPQLRTRVRVNTTHTRGNAQGGPVCWVPRPDEDTVTVRFGVWCTRRIRKHSSIFNLVLGKLRSWSSGLICWTSQTTYGKARGTAPSSLSSDSTAAPLDASAFFFTLIFLPPSPTYRYP